MSIGIYSIRNNLNNKIYIGQSVHIERRWVEHCLPSSKSVISMAIKKYGKENFTFQILEECKLVELDRLEKEYMQKYNSFIPNGYNIMQSIGNHQTQWIENSLSQEKFYFLVEDLLNSNLTFEELANKYSICTRTITRINHGYVHHHEEWEYPLRDTKRDIAKPKCIDCGGQVSSSSALRCSNCSSVYQRVVKTRPSREELKELIWTLPFTKIGEKYRVSDNAVRKWCESEGLPKKKSSIRNYSKEEWDRI